MKVVIEHEDYKEISNKIKEIESALDGIREATSKTELYDFCENITLNKFANLCLDKGIISKEQFESMMELCRDLP